MQGYSPAILQGEAISAIAKAVFEVFLVKSAIFERIAVIVDFLKNAKQLFVFDPIGKSRFEKIFDNM